MKWNSRAICGMIKSNCPITDFYSILQGAYFLYEAAILPLAALAQKLTSKYRLKMPYVSNLQLAYQSKEALQADRRLKG